MAEQQAEVIVMRIAGGWSQSLKGYRRQVNSWCNAALAGRKGVLSVVLANDATLKRLNRDYRGANKPTNVLSFAGEGGELGDIILAYETVKREAKAQGKSFLRHTAHMVVHGCLHLLGYDHESESDAQAMEKREKTVLAQLGFPDPYII